MIAATVGSTSSLGLLNRSASAATRGEFSSSDDELTFGAFEPLVDMLQQTSADKLIGVLVEKIRTGTSLRDLAAATALANARAFGGEDYVGFHTLMAIGPALEISERLDARSAPLPLIKIALRNAKALAAANRHSTSTLRSLKVESSINADVKPGRYAELMKSAVHSGDLAKAESTLAISVSRRPMSAYQELLDVVEESAEVHRVVLAARSWELLDLVGRDRAETMLRQSLRYCVKNEKHREKSPCVPPVDILADALDVLAKRPITGIRTLSDVELGGLSEELFRASPADAIGVVVERLKIGVSPADVGEAIALGATQLTLRDAGLREKDARPGKPAGSVHGDSIGVHASDSANAWRYIHSVESGTHQVSSVLLSAFQLAVDRVARGGDFLNRKPYPTDEHLGSVGGDSTPERFIDAIDDAIRHRDQGRAAALTKRFGETVGDAEAFLKLARRHAVDEDGALHAEKYYRTCSQEYSRTRRSRRWDHLVALARVTASMAGNAVAELSEARERLAKSG
jgi:hypothetical protein